MVIIVNTGGVKVGRDVGIFDEDNYDEDLFSFESDFVEEDLDFEFPDNEDDYNISGYEFGEGFEDENEEGIEEWARLESFKDLGIDIGEELGLKTDSRPESKPPKEFVSRFTEVIDDGRNWVNIDNILMSKKRKTINTILLSGVLAIGITMYIVNTKIK